MIIRSMTASDTPSVIGIEEECFASERWQADDFIYRLDKCNFINLVAEVDETVAGYITASYLFDEISIDSIAVRSDFRRKGYAAELIKKAFEYSAAKTAILEVRKSNLGAIALYEALGFEKLGERKDYYQQPVENAIIMTMSIDN